MLLGATGCVPGSAPIPFKEVPQPPAQVEPTDTPQAPRKSALETLNPIPSALGHKGAMLITGDLDNPVAIIKDGRYHPYYSHVRLGGTVTWINEERTTQSVTSPVPGAVTRQGDWGGGLAPGERYSMTFNRTTGTFTYFSTFNPDQHGNIIVVGDKR